MVNWVSIILIVVVAFAAYQLFIANKGTSENPEVPTPPANNTPPPATEEPVNEPEPNYDFIVRFIDVGQGDSTLITYPSGYVMLVDGGPRLKAIVLVNYLLSLNITVIDSVVATHMDSDHIGGLGRVFNTFIVKEFVYPNSTCNTLACEELMKISEREKSNNHAVDNTMLFFVDNMSTTQILHPPMAPIKNGDKNENSLVLKISYEQISFLFTGDCESACEDEMISTNRPIDSDVLKVSHHGSNSSTSQRFLDKVTPTHSIISVGSNSYGHPSLEVISRLMNYGNVYRTDNMGTITFLTDGEKVEVLI